MRKDYAKRLLPLLRSKPPGYLPSARYTFAADLIRTVTVTARGLDDAKVKAVKALEKEGFVSVSSAPGVSLVLLRCEVTERVPLTSAKARRIRKSRRPTPLVL